MRGLAVIGLAAVAVVALVGVGTAADKSPDWSIAPRVKLELLTKLGADALHISVDSTEGNVQLSGTVGKRETKELATTVARSVSGVKGVDNALRLEAQVGTSTAQKGVDNAETMVKDGVLDSKVRIALIDKLGSDGFKIGIEVANGVVTLQFGPELTKERRETAVSAAKSVTGVTKVITLDKKS